MQSLIIDYTYDKISPLNKRAGRPFILRHIRTMGRNEYGISGHLHVFAFFEALNGAFEVQFFQGLMTYTFIKDTDQHTRDM